MIPYMLIRYWILLIIVPLVVAFLFLTTIVFLTVLNHLHHSRRERNAEKQAYLEDHDVLGRRLPPTARGFCTQCETLTKKSLLPSGWYPVVRRVLRPKIPTAIILANPPSHHLL